MTVKKGWSYWIYKGEEEERNGDFNKAGILLRELSKQQLEQIRKGDFKMAQ